MKVIKTILITLIVSLLVITIIRCGAGKDPDNGIHLGTDAPAQTLPQKPTGTPEPTIQPVTGMTGIAAESAILIDVSTGAVLWDKNGGMKMYPASTTKIMTALLAIEYIDPDSMLNVGDEANRAEPGSSIAGLDYGEDISFKNILYALMLPSGNDAAYVIAVNTARIASGDHDMSIDDAITYFVNMMNERAQELGADNTYFCNPDGFHDENHVTTAYDLALIARKAMEYELFREIVSTEHVRIDDYKQFNENDPSYRDWYNTNELIQGDSSDYYEYATGIKTGHTENAGYCVVASAQKNPGMVIAVVLNSTQEAVFTDARTLLDACFK